MRIANQGDTSTSFTMDVTERAVVAPNPPEDSDAPADDQKPPEGEATPAVVLFTDGTKARVTDFALKNGTLLTAQKGRTYSYPIRAVRGLQTVDGLFLHNVHSGQFESYTPQDFIAHPQVGGRSRPVPRNQTRAAYERRERLGEFVVWAAKNFGEGYLKEMGASAARSRNSRE